MLQKKHAGVVSADILLMLVCLHRSLARLLQSAESALVMWSQVQGVERAEVHVAVGHVRN